MSRTLNLPTKRFSLSHLGDDWKDAYLEYVPLTPRELLEVKKLDPEAMGEEASMEYVLGLVASNFRAGKVSVIQDGKPALDDAAVEDVSALPIDVLMGFFSAMTGGPTDPKGVEPTAMPSSTTSGTSVRSTPASLPTSGTESASA